MRFDWTKCIKIDEASGLKIKNLFQFSAVLKSSAKDYESFFRRSNTDFWLVKYRSSVHLPSIKKDRENKKNCKTWQKGPTMTMEPPKATTNLSCMLSFRVDIIF